MNGILCVNKPEGWTSFDVIAKLRKLLHIKKMGHAGTLDPMATGVLPVFLGKATKLISYLEDHDKIYEAEFKLGVTTTTLDRTGEVLTNTSQAVDRQELAAALSKYRGVIFQTPPMYSAVKVHGKRLYELARKGAVVAREKRKVYIYDLRLQRFDQQKQQGSLCIHCSQGTYIRTLCDDIGRDLQVGGILTSLIRTGACGFSLKNCYSLEEIQRGAFTVISLDDYCKKWPCLLLTRKQARIFCQGGFLRWDAVEKERMQDKTLLTAVYFNDSLLGLARLAEGKAVKAERVFYDQMKDPLDLLKKQ